SCKVGTTTQSSLVYRSVKTMFVRFFKGLEPGNDSKVFPPITMIFPTVFSLKNLKSAGRWNNMSLFLPIPHSLSTQTMAFILNRDLYLLIQGVKTVIFQREIVYGKVV